jgi:enoyl-[acyl-carrier-protein] reductase (NADH)
MGKMETALGRAIEPKEIVDFVLYLASDSCPSVTGSTHLVDAGRLCVGRGSTAGFLEAGK